MPLDIVFIGDRFYTDSGTMMSPLYRKVNGEFHRYDYGFMARDLAKGMGVNIRQACPEEKVLFLEMLLQHRKPSK